MGKGVALKTETKESVWLIGIKRSYHANLISKREKSGLNC